MDERLKLHNILLSIVNNVYYQPPESLRLKYDCIVYERDYIDSKYANNSPYLLFKRYKLTVISTKPDSRIPDEVAKLPKCSFNRHYVADNLYHDVFEIYV